MGKRRISKGGGWILKYTAMYLLAVLPMIAILLISGKTFFWGSDAYNQQYTTLWYTGRSIRNLFSGNGFSMMDFSLGQGMDVLGTLAYYGLTDPLQWLGACFTGFALELYYHALVFGYIYLSGLLFCVLMRRTLLKGHANAWLVALCGMMFAFCGYQTIGIIKNPYYASGAIYLLLMLIAMERALAGRGWKCLSLVTLLMLMANFYLAFQTSLLAALYALIRLLARFRTNGLRGCVRDGLMLMGAYLLGLLMSMWMLLPVAHAFMDSSRVQVETGYRASLWHYPAGYYLKLLMLFCAPYDYAGYWSLQSFCPLALLSVALLLLPEKADAVERRQRGQLRAAFLLAFGFLCVPLAGKLFNGMGYATNRWCYGYAAAVCAVSAWGMRRMTAPEFGGRKRLAGFGFIWAAAMLAYALFAHRIHAFDGGSNQTAVGDYGLETKNIAAAAGALALLAASVCLRRMDGGLRKKQERTMRALALLTTFCCVAYSVGYAVTAANSSEFMDRGIEKRIWSQGAAASRFIDDDAFYRLDSGNSEDSHAPMLGYRGTAYYWSMIPRWTADYYVGLEQSSLRWTFRLNGLGADRYVEAMAAVGYCVRGTGAQAMCVPDGFVPLDAETGEASSRVRLYQNAYALPLGVIFESAMSEADYDALSPVEKREALVSCAILEDAASMPAFADSLPMEALAWTVERADGVEMEDGMLRARSGGTLTLRFEGRPDSDTYLRFAGSCLTACSDDTDTLIFSESEAGTNGMYIIYPQGNFNYSQTGSCLSVGFSEAGLHECTLRFRDDVEMSFDALEIWSVPSAYARNALEALRDRGGWTPEIERDFLHGSVTLERDGVLQISVPYGRGWSAMVDGKRATLLRCGGMYMGIALSAGTHDVQLRYETPGLKAGALVSLVALGLCAMLGKRKIGKKKRENRADF